MKEAELEVLRICQEIFTPGVPAAALMGNIAVESDSSFSYEKKQYGGGSAKGLFQFEPPMFAAYTKFLAASTLTDSARSQVMYVHSEVMHGGHHIGGGNATKIRKAFESGDVELATRTFCDLFERPNKAKEHMDRRIQAAKEYLEAQKSK